MALIISKIKSNEERLLIIATIFLTMSQFIAPPVFPQAKPIFGAISMLICLILIIFSGFSKRNYFYMFIFMFLIVLSTVGSGRQSVLISVIFLVSIYGKDYRKVLKTILIVSILSILSSLVANALINGIQISNFEYRTVFGKELLIIKESFGYQHANMLFLVVFIPCMIYMYLRYENLKWYEHVSIFIIITLAFVLTFSRTGYLVYLCMLIICFITKHSDNSNSIFTQVLINLPLIVLILSFLLPMIFTYLPNPTTNFLNRSLSDRIYYSSEFLHVTNPSLFGMKVEGLYGRPGFPLTADNSFVLSLRAYGYIVFTMIVVLTYRIRKFKWSSKDLFVITSCYIYCFAEAFFVNAVFNISLIIIVNKIFEENNRKEGVNEMTRYSIFNTFVDALTLEESVQRVKEIVKNGVPTQHVVINASKINLMKNDQKLTDIVNSCPLINADGASILWAAKKMGIHLPERVTGIDLFNQLVIEAEKEGLKIYLFGAKQEVVEKVKSIFTEKYPKLKIVGTRNGYFTEDENSSIVEDIANSGADILFVAFSSPQKEYWINQNLNTLNVPFCMGVGGSFDVIAGVTKRAPLWMQKIGLEWFYRFIQEPLRLWERYIVGNFKFVLYTYSTKRKNRERR